MLTEGVREHKTRARCGSATLFENSSCQIRPLVLTIHFF
jgi:hypothetical protein